MRSLSKCISVILLTSLLTACLFGNLNLREGIHSFKVQDYRRAFIRLVPEAQKGQPDAQYAVGYMFYYGQGVVENRHRALFWINRAANAGQPDAINAITMLEHKVK